MQHLDASPPRRYSFKEWTWLLKLLGEDETNEAGHRRVGQALPQGAEVATPIRTNEKQMWSWLGQESPLMSLEEGELSRALAVCPDADFLGTSRQRAQVGAEALDVGIGAGAQVSRRKTHRKGHRCRALAPKQLEQQESREEGH